MNFSRFHDGVHCVLRRCALCDMYWGLGERERERDTCTYLCWGLLLPGLGASWGQIFTQSVPATCQDIPLRWHLEARAQQMTPSSQDAFESLGPGCGHESPLGGVLRGAHHFSCAPAPMWLPRGVNISILIGNQLASLTLNAS